MGGTLAYYARQGCLVYLVCATRGEAGMVDGEHLRGFESVADLREAELRCAAQILGLSGVFFLNYRDSGMAIAIPTIFIFNRPPLWLSSEPQTPLSTPRLAPRFNRWRSITMFFPAGSYG